MRYALRPWPKQTPHSRQEQAIANADIDYLKEELPSAIEQSLEGARRVAKIVRALKDFAHPGASDIADANINEAIESTITIARNE